MTSILIKSVHIVAMAIWLGGMLMLAVAMTAWKSMAQADVPIGLQIFAAVQRWNQTVTLPAMALTWITGLALTMMGNWPPATHAGFTLLALTAWAGLSHGHRI